jgi:hypothetical protein
VLLKKKPHLEEFMNWYNLKDAVKEIFD